MKQLSLFAILSCFLAGCSTPLPQGNPVVIERADLDEIARSLILVQEQVLHATIPRPTGSAVTNDCAEIVRRITIVLSTWADTIKGREDAQTLIDKGVCMLKGSNLLNEAESTYARLLKRKYGVVVEEPKHSILNESQLAYVYGFNTEMSRHLTEIFGPDEFRNAMTTVIEECECGKGGEFFIPWRFSFEDHCIEGTARVAEGSSRKRRLKPALSRE